MQECGGCGFLNLARCGALEHVDKHWCERFNDWRWPIGENTCAEYDRRTCGTCVVYNGDALTGTCSIMGPRTADEAPCRRWYGKTELGRALYGRAERA